MNGTLQKCIIYMPAGTYEAREQMAIYDDEPIDMETGIGRNEMGGATPSAHIYNMRGELVKANATSLDNLPAGIYIWAGRRVVVR